MKFLDMMQAHSEAKRFIRLVEQVRTELPEFKDYQIGGSKHTSAVKRASMGLTRALAKMRRAV